VEWVISRGKFKINFFPSPFHLGKIPLQQCTKINKMVLLQLSLLISLWISVIAFKKVSYVKKFTYIKEASSEQIIGLTNPAKTFIRSVEQASNAALQAIKDGEKLLEVEFPPLPIDYLDDSSSSARDLSRANTRWAYQFAKNIASFVGNISIIYPDQAELDDAIEYIDQDTNNPSQNITLATIRSDSIKNAVSLDQIVSSIFGATKSKEVTPISNTKLYVAIVFSTQEIPDLEKLFQLNPTIPIVFFNLKLDYLVSIFI
jgi:hypothetical protein